ncbi:MAG: lipopolysaccharide transport periplasmic protein LptA [Burkholderiaceae bacterium]|jgi:lipopolysaccharide export system protein LptA
MPLLSPVSSRLLRPFCPLPQVRSTAAVRASRASWAPLVLGAAVCVMLASVSGVARAEKADRDKPMNVEADAMRHDEARQVSVFTGRVVLSKGTLLIRGARMEVRQDAQGYQYGTVTAESGQRAFLRQKREGVDEFIEGESQTIEYDGRADRVRFVGNAELRRLRGTALADQLNGSLIVYDNGSDTFSVDGAPAGGSGRVRAVLTPRNAASAPAAPTTPGGAAPSAPAAPGLRSSPALGGARP